MIVYITERNASYTGGIVNPLPVALLKHVWCPLPW